MGFRSSSNSRSIASVAIIDACRSPIGKIRGVLSGVRPDDLLAAVFKASLTRTGLDSAGLDEVFAGCANQAGEDNRNVARMAWLLAGGDDSVAACTVNRLCASGLEAVIQGYRAIALGPHRVVLCGGVESMSRAPWVMAKSERGYANGNKTVYDSSLGWRFENPKLAERFELEAMGKTAENIIDRLGETIDLSRQRQDAFALASHQKALAAIASGRFEPELVPIEVRHRKTSLRIEQDEGPRADTDLERLAALRAVFKEGGSVTAGNSSTLNDGAAAVMLANLDWARAQGLPILAEIVDVANAGIDPRVMGLGPIPATQKLLKQSDLSVADLDLIELNEAFAAQSLAVIDQLGLNVDSVNVNGGAIALGHPLGCSGTRILTTLVHEMGRREAELGLATLCVGVGQGSAMLLKNAR